MTAASTSRVGWIAAGLVGLGVAGWAQAMAPDPVRLPADCSQPSVVGDRLQCDGQGTPPGARVWLAGGRLDLNAASRQDLRALPGVGPKTAEAILENRLARGPFPNAEALARVKGIGPKTVARLRPWIEVGGPGR